MLALLHGVASTATSVFHTVDSTGTQLPQICVEVDFTNDPTIATRVWTDVTSDVRSITWKRGGRSNELQRSEPGTLQMLLDNTDGAYDSTNQASRNYPGVKRMRWVRVQAKWAGVVYPRWTGLIERYRQTWPEAGLDATVQVEATDSLKVLNLFDLAGLSFDSEEPGQRVRNVLSAAGLANQNIETGVNTALAPSGVFADQSFALSHLLDVENTENGFLFAAADGTVVFHNRQHRLLNSGTPAATIGDGGPSEIPYRQGELAETDEDLWNVVSVTPQDGVSQVASDTGSVGSYYRRKLNRQILSMDDSEALSAAQYLVGRYANSLPRVPAVDLVGRVYPAQWATVLGLKNGDRVVWKRRAAANAISQEMFVERVAESVVPGADWLVSLELSPAGDQSGWVLGDAVLGVLGSTTRATY